jgi:replicative DNA helicase
MTVPSNTEAEQALLGAILYDNAAVDRFEGLDPKHFYEPFHGRLYEAMAREIDKGRTAEPILLNDLFAADPQYVEIGGVQYLRDLFERAPPAAAARGYADAIVDAAIRRGLIQFATEAAVAATVREGDKSAFEALSDVRSALDALENSATPAEHTMIAAPEAAGAAIEVMRDVARTGKRRGRMTGLRCVDRRLGGLRPGALIIVGGRPSMGKTSVARAIAHGAAVRNPECAALFLGIEMGPEEMMQRELSALTWEMGDGIEYRGMGDGELTAEDFATLDLAHRRVPRNLILDDCHSLSAEDVRRKIWTVQRRHPVSVVVIDYLQLMRRPDAKGRNEATVLGEMTASLKQTARQAKTCIVLLSQLSRQVESRDDKRPQLSDLRESGAIEQDADAVLFPYREVYYVERSEPKENTTEHAEWMMKCADLRTRLDVICAKQRQGPVGTDQQIYIPGNDYISDCDEEAYR